MTNMNKAIWTVLTTKFKKEAPEVFKQVQEKYTVEKWNGFFSVYNKETGRRLYIVEMRNGGWNLYCRRYLDMKKAEKVDFEGFLQKPNNTEWIALTNKDETSGALKKFENLKYARRQAKWVHEKISHIEQEIVKLQKQLEVESKRAVQKDIDVENEMKKLGLIK